MEKRPSTQIQSLEQFVQLLSKTPHRWTLTKFDRGRPCAIRTCDPFEYCPIRAVALHVGIGLVTPEIWSKNTRVMGLYLGLSANDCHQIILASDFDHWDGWHLYNIRKMILEATVLRS